MRLLPYLFVLGCWAGGQLGAQPVSAEDRLTEAAKARVHTLRIRIQPTWLAEPGA